MQVILKWFKGFYGTIYINFYLIFLKEVNCGEEKKLESEYKFQKSYKLSLLHKRK